MPIRTSDNDGARSEAEILARWKKRVAAHRERLLRLHRGGMGGFDVCGENTAFFDGLVAEVVSQASGGTIPAGVALCATGSYGRSELAPHSDVDLVVLLGEGNANGAGAFVHEVVRLLWDIGLTLSHTARTLAQSLELAASDPAVKTTYLDLRFLKGHGRLLEEMRYGFEQLVQDGAVGPEIPRNQEAVHQVQGYPLSSITELEPDLKNSPGSLRDFHLAMWTARLHYFEKAAGLSTLADAGIIDVRTRIEVGIAVDLLLRLRNELHFLFGRKADTLVLEAQAEVAENLGYIAAGPEQAVEAMMRDYYGAAATVFRFSKDLVDRCLGRARPAPTGGAETIEAGVVRVGGELDFTGPEAIVAEPVLLVRAFRIAAQKGLGLSLHARKVLRSVRYLVDEEVRDNAEAAAEFMSLLRAPHSADALRAMHECHVLGDYLPEFGGLHHLVQYDVFHRFTADEHTLLTLYFLEELDGADDPATATLAGLWREIDDGHVVKLALLLHDIGKAGGPGHIARGLRMIPLVAHRLGLSAEQTDRVLHLVRHHGLMNELALKRDIHDRDTLRGFVATIENVDSLKRLYLITYADMKAVGPGVWNDWKAALLEELYHRGLRMLEREGDETDDEYYRRVREEHAQRLREEASDEALDAYFARMPVRFLSWLTPERILRHLEILARGCDSPCAVRVDRDDAVGYHELTVCSRDTHGLLSRIAGVVTAHGLNILGAQVYTLTDGVVLDTIQAQPIGVEPAPADEEIAAAVSRDLTGVLQGRIDVRELVERRPRFFKKRGKDRLHVPSDVIVDNDLSRDHTVVEVTARDRPGLLFEITDLFREIGVNIYLAKINTEAFKAVDIFYLTKTGGGKIDDADLRREIEVRIRKILRANGGERGR